MPRFTIESAFWELFPEATVGVLICEDVNNALPLPDAPQLLAQAQTEALRHLPLAEFSQNDVIQTWRGAYSKFKTKKGARSSIEALLKRAQSVTTGGSGIGSINPLVDLYNSVSLRYAVPCGGEDLDTMQGDIRLTTAQGDEPFVILGSEVSEPPLPGELVYKDEAGAICRCLNWREAQRTMLTPGTRRALMCLENVNPDTQPQMLAALDELEWLIRERLGATITRHVLTREQPSISWS